MESPAPRLPRPAQPRSAPASATSEAPPIVPSAPAHRSLGQGLVLLLANGAMVLLLMACSGGSTQIARYGSQQLTLEDLRLLLSPDMLSGRDSASVVQAFAKAWKDEQALAEAAERALPDVERQVEARIADYRRKQKIALWEDHLLRTQLDTVVPAAELQKYYQENAARYQSTEQRWQFYYLQAPEPAPDYLSAAMTGTDPGAMTRLRDWAAGHARRALLDDNWRTLAELDLAFSMGGLLYAGVQTTGAVSTQVTQEGGKPLYHYLYLKSTRPAGSPLSLAEVTAQIRQILLQRRAQELLARSRSEALRQAQAEGKLP